MTTDQPASPLDVRRMFLRAAVVVPISAIAAAAFLSAFVGVASLLVEGRAFADAIGGAWFGFMFLGPWVLAGFLVLGAAAAAVAVAVTVWQRRVRSNRALRSVWVGTYSAIVVLALLVITLGSARYFPIAIAGVAVILLAVSWSVFAIADRQRPQ